MTSSCASLVGELPSEGYAYGGGGRRITRVKLSLGKGKTWRLANIDYDEDRYREAGEQYFCGGRLEMSWRESSLCWCFWNIDIPVNDMRIEKDMLVRQWTRA